MLEEIEKSLQEITQGEWEYKFFNSAFWIPEIASIKRKSDAKFIASAPRWLRWCLEEIEFFKGECQTWQESYDDVYKEGKDLLKENESLRKEVEGATEDGAKLLYDNVELRKEVERLRNVIDDKENLISMLWKKEQPSQI